MSSNTGRRVKALEQARNHMAAVNSGRAKFDADAMAAYLRTGAQRSMIFDGKEIPMRRSSHGFDTDSLFQRDPNDDSHRNGNAFFTLWQNRRTSRRLASRGAKPHAFDEGLNHDGALEQLDRARNHIIAVKGGHSVFDPEAMSGYFNTAMDCMTGSDDAADDDVTEAERDKLSDEASMTGRDGTGEVPARSGVSNAESGNPNRRDGSGGTRAGGGRWGGASSVQGNAKSTDHRKDFNSIAQGHDSAGADFDAEAMFQKSRA